MVSLWFNSERLYLSHLPQQLVLAAPQHSLHEGLGPPEPQQMLRPWPALRSSDAVEQPSAKAPDEGAQPGLARELENNLGLAGTW